MTENPVISESEEYVSTSVQAEQSTEVTQTQVDLNAALEQMKKKFVYDKKLHLSFGNNLSGARILSEYRGNIDLEVLDSHKKEALQGVLGLLMSEMEKITGKSYNISLQVASNSKKSDEAKDMESYISKSATSQLNEDPYEKAIIEILGGQRIA